MTTPLPHPGQENNDPLSTSSVPINNIGTPLVATFFRPVRGEARTVGAQRWGGVGCESCTQLAHGIFALDIACSRFRVQTFRFAHPTVRRNSDSTVLHPQRKRRVEGGTNFSLFLRKPSKRSAIRPIGKVSTLILFNKELMLFRFANYGCAVAYLTLRPPPWETAEFIACREAMCVFAHSLIPYRPHGQVSEYLRNLCAVYPALVEYKTSVRSTNGETNETFKDCRNASGGSVCSDAGSGTHRG